MIVPKNVKSDSQVKRIILLSIYSKPNSRKKTLLLDYISDVFNVISKKHPEGTY